MSINLTKGQRINLKKDNETLNKIKVGLGWDPVKQSKGFFSSLFSVDSDIDCDASIFMLNNENKLATSKDLIYFGNLKSNCNSVTHTGDNLTGEGDGDDEEILIELNKVPSRISKLLFTVNIYGCLKRKQHFGMIENAYIRVLDDKGKEFIKYNLSESYSNKTALMVAEIYRHNGEWKFSAVGEGTNDDCLQSIMNRINS